MRWKPAVLRPSSAEYLAEDAEGAVPMQYDVLTPDKKPLGGLIPWTAKYNTGK